MNFISVVAQLLAESGGPPIQRGAGAHLHDHPAAGAIDALNPKEPGPQIPAHP